MAGAHFESRSGGCSCYSRARRPTLAVSDEAVGCLRIVQIVFSLVSSLFYIPITCVSILCLQCNHQSIISGIFVVNKGSKTRFGPTHVPFCTNTWSGRSSSTIQASSSGSQRRGPARTPLSTTARGRSTRNSIQRTLSRRQKVGYGMLAKAKVAHHLDCSTGTQTVQFIFAVAQAPAVDLRLHLPGVRQDSYPTGLRSRSSSFCPSREAWRLVRE